MTAFDWEQLLHDTRGYLATVEDFDEDGPVPVDELVATAEANGYAEREVRDAVREADALEAVGDLDDLRVRLADAASNDTAVSGETAPENPEEPGSPDTTPTPEAEEAVSPEGESDLKERAHEAFAAAVEFFHNQLDRDISGEFDAAPDTPRNYYEGVRGWSPETIADKRLGYAPADGMALLDHLMSEGFDGDAIQGTGLFYEDFTPHFQGRYVLPYFDEGGRPVYAISRSLNHHEDGHGDDPKGDQKYTKAIKTKDRSYVDEPIYGAETVTDDTDRLLVVGGIADAITLHEAGYACISPVTTVRFKSKHEPRVAELVDEYGLDGVYMLNDAERPSVDSTELEDGETVDRIGDVLTIMQHGEGLRGAFGNAEFLLDEGIDAYLVKLPAGGDYVRKIDPDDVIKDGWASVDTLLAAARHADHHDGYQGWAANRRSREVRDAMEMGDRASDQAGETTELFDLEFTDVAPLSVGDRQNNPFGHHGNSEGYFVCAEKQGFVHGYDHKYSVAYNALSYLLCDAGERRADDPNGPLDDGELFVAWRHAKSHGHLATADPIPFAALREVAVRDGVVERDDLVERGDSSTYLGFPDADAYNAALEHIQEEYGLDPGREPADRGREADDSAEEEYLETDRDLLDVDVVVEPAKALAAAGAVEPDDLDNDLPELEREGVDDVAIAVALAEGRIDGPDEFPDNGGYTEAYYRARDHYGAPLPKYLDNTTLEEREDLVFAALERVGPQHILGSTRSEITVEDPDGVAFAKLNPTWEDSDSGERILAGYGRGFYCVEHDVTFSPIQLVALEHDLISSETEYPRGEAFKQAYRRLREDYGAPLPKWRATVLEHVAILPPAVRLMGDSSAGPSLEDAHGKTEALVRDAVDVRDRAQLLTMVPGAGKTYSTAVVGGEKPILYLAGRNELKVQMAEYCRQVRADDEDHPDAEPTTRHLPIFAENQLPDEVILDAVRAIEEEGRGLLKDHDALLGRVEIPDDWDEDDEDSVNLPRESCTTGDGEHGPGWALAVQTARALGQTPQEIHTHDTVLFGDELPCQHGGDCSYTLGWEAVREPECADVLIGSPGHAYVGSATTYFEPDGDGGTEETPRAVVLDEFPGDEYVTEYGDRYLDHATWLADALVGVGTRENLTRADLETDTWVTHWLDGDGGELTDVAEAIDALRAGAALCDAREDAADLLDDGRLDGVSDTSARLPAVRDALENLVDGGPTDADLDAIAADLATAEATVRDDAENAYATDAAHAGALYGLADDLDSVLTSLSVAVDRDEGLLAEAERTTDALDVGGDLRRLLDDAVGALRGEDHPEALLDVAVTALQGGREGCRELAIFAEDGYAHPDAWALLAGAIADDVAEVETETFAFDGDDGGRFKHLTKNDATIAADKNHHGALVADHPAFTDITGAKCPVLGLDATGRPALWRLALGRDTQRRDIHDTDAERRRFLRDAMNLTVVQTTNDPLPYHGKPDGKNFAEDLELVKTVAEELTGVGADTLDDDAPAVISTKKVLDHFKENGDLDGLAGDTVNYENMKGSDALGDRLVSIILGSCHFGDAAPEKWGLLAGEDAGRGDTRGDTLDYGSDVANTFLKHMREDYTMQAILRAGRNDDASVVFAHTSALRDDLPVDEEGAVLSAHSKGTLAVAEAAKDFRGEAFTANDVVEAIADDERAVGRRQVQNVLADLREGGYLRVVEEGGPGVGYEYELDENPGLADVDLPNPDVSGDTVPGETSENPANRTLHTWNFRSRDGEEAGTGVTPPTRPTIPAREAADAVGPPG